MRERDHRIDQDLARDALLPSGTVHDRERGGQVSAGAVAGRIELLRVEPQLLRKARDQLQDRVDFLRLHRELLLRSQRIIDVEHGTADMLGQKPADVLRVKRGADIETAAVNVDQRGRVVLLVARIIHPDRDRTRGAVGLQIAGADLRAAEVRREAAHAVPQPFQVDLAAGRALHLHLKQTHLHLQKPGIDLILSGRVRNVFHLDPAAAALDDLSGIEQFQKQCVIVHVFSAFRKLRHRADRILPIPVFIVPHTALFRHGFHGSPFLKVYKKGPPRRERPLAFLCFGRSGGFRRRGG